MDRHQRVLSGLREVVVGHTVGHVWRGHGSAIFLELGALTSSTRADGRLGQPRGDISIGIEWNWRFERPRSILGGTWSDERRWPAFFRPILGQSIRDLAVLGTLPEIELTFSNSMRLRSFMNDAGQPQWSVIERTSSQARIWCVERGRIVHKTLVDLPDVFEGAPMRGDA